jgi:hypothetical protein
MTAYFRLVGAAVFCAMSVGCAKPEQPLQAEEGVEAASVLANAAVAERLIERSVPRVPATGKAPSFVVDPAWPKMLPNNWIIGDIGGLHVDRHDHIWVYHRPRALAASDAGALGEGGKDAKGAPISVLGHPRRFGQVSGCCIPAPSVLQFDKAGNLKQAGAVQAIRGFSKSDAARKTDACGLRVSTAFTSITTTSSTSLETGRR